MGNAYKVMAEHADKTVTSISEHQEVVSRLGAIKIHFWLIL